VHDGELEHYSRKRAVDLITAWKPHYTYIAYGRGDVVLYVGQTNQPIARLRAHSKSSLWWPKVYRVALNIHETRRDGLQAEYRLIRELRPKYNVAGN